MVAKFLDDNKPIKSLKSLFERSYSISLTLANLGECYLSLEKESDNFCAVFTYSIKRALEIRRFHVIVVQRRRRDVQNSVMQMQSCCLLI